MERAEYLHDYYDKYLRAVQGHRALLDARPVVDHLHACLDSGMPISRIAALAGVPDSTIRKLLNAPDRRVRAQTSERILAITPSRPVTAIGITRRIRALAAIGWSTARVAQHAGIGVKCIKAWRRGEVENTWHVESVMVRTYDALQMSRPVTTTPGERASASRAITEARRHGWAPPLAWDDIDDPVATPDLGDKPAKHGADIDEWLFLIQGGEEPVRAASRMGVTIGAIEKAGRRAGRPDVYELAGRLRQRARNVRYQERQKELRKAS